MAKVIYITAPKPSPEVPAGYGKCDYGQIDWRAFWVWKVKQ